MKKIIIAGAGHGGLTAAANLAKAGYRITVLEKSQRSTIGHDWNDCISRSVFEQCGIQPPAEEHFLPFHRMCYRSASKSVKIVTPERKSGGPVNIDRKILLHHLIGQAEESGVSFLFGTEVTRPACENGRVTGVFAKENRGEETLFPADLVIDAAGCFSSVRTNLPAEAGIINEIAEKDLFSTFRAYYDKRFDPHLDPPYNIYFFHCGRMGMDWVIDENGFADVLIGAFGPLSPKDCETALADFRGEYPFLGEKLLRGGSFTVIPVRRALPLFVWNRYAAVGDSAAMTEPLSGSGIGLSMRAGKFLADTVMAAGEKELTTEVLWEYEYRYMKELGLRQLPAEITKNMLTDLTARDMDLLFEKKVLTAKELGTKQKYTARDYYDKAVGILSHPSVLPVLMKMALRNAKLGKIRAALPAQYAEESVKRWIKLYENLIEKQVEK